MIQYYHYLMHQINEIKRKMSSNENLKQNVTSIAYLEEEEEEEDEEEDD